MVKVATALISEDGQERLSNRKFKKVVKFLRDLN